MLSKLSLIFMAIVLLQKIFLSELSAFSSYTLYKNIWSWPNFVNCLAPGQRDNCSQIMEEDVNNLKIVSFYIKLTYFLMFRD